MSGRRKRSKARAVSLTDASAVATFKVGECLDLDDVWRGGLSYEDACSIFGQRLVDEYVSWRAVSRPGPAGVATVTSIDADAGVLTFGVRTR